VGRQQVVQSFACSSSTARIFSSGIRVVAAEAGLERPGEAEDVERRPRASGEPIRLVRAEMSAQRGGLALTESRCAEAALIRRGEGGELRR